MKTVSFLYGRGTYELEVPENTPVLTSRIDQLKSERDGLTIVREAMENPIDSPRLCELAEGKPDCTIIISDHTRPVPSQDILPNMIRELREGNPDIENYTSCSYRVSSSDKYRGAERKTRRRSL